MIVRAIPRDAARKPSLAQRLWPIWDIDLNSPTQTVEALKDGVRPGLIVLHVQASAQQGFRTGKAAGGQRDATYWFDPKRDDLPVEIYQRAGDAGDVPLPLEYRRVRMKFAQLANGRGIRRRSNSAPRGGCPRRRMSRITSTFIASCSSAKRCRRNGTPTRPSFFSVDEASRAPAGAGKPSKTFARTPSGETPAAAGTRLLDG
jgi:hypothetical protein